MPEPSAAPEWPPVQWPPEVERLRTLLADAGAPIYLVGGTVRDALLGRPLKDIDLATPGDGLSIARRLADDLGAAFYPLDAERGVGRVVLDRPEGRLFVDIARFRGATLVDDLRARDFTVNALAAALTGDPARVIDPLDGVADLRARRLRLCAPNAIAADPTRALRAVRLSAALKLHIEAETQIAIRRDGARLVDVAAERVRDEFMAILQGPQPAGALRVLDALGLVDIVFPEADAMRGLTQSPPHAETLWEHTLRVVDRMDAVLRVIGPERTDNTAAQAGLGLIVMQLDPYRADLQAHLAQPWPDGRTARGLILLSALLHDVGKPVTMSREANGRVRFINHDRVGAAMAEARCQALRLSRNEVRRVARVVQHHMRPMLLANEPVVTGRAIYRFFRDAKDGAGVDVCLLALADYLGTVGVSLDLEDWTHYVAVVAQLVGAYFRQRREMVEPPLLLTGRDIKAALGLPAGPRIGELLEALREAQASGEVSTREEALAFVKAAGNGEGRGARRT
ncbi:MAG: CCA tRNA nucleotidyltransferase [Anaerolineae bacterium]